MWTMWTKKLSILALLMAVVLIAGKRGTISGADGGHLRVLLDQDASTVYAHPTWNVVYHRDGVGGEA